MTQEQFDNLIENLLQNHYITIKQAMYLIRVQARAIECEQYLYNLTIAN